MVLYADQWACFLNKCFRSANLYENEGRCLLLQTEFPDERAVGALVGPLKILEVLAAVGDKAEQTAAGVLIFIIFTQMSTQLLDTTRQKSHLHLRRTGVRVVPARFCGLVLLLSLRKHGRNVSYSGYFSRRGGRMAAPLFWLISWLY